MRGKFNKLVTIRSLSYKAVLMLCLMIPYVAFADIEVGTVVFASGEVQVIDQDKRKRFVIKGDLIFDKDTLVTGDGRAQVKFTDGGRVSLKKNTIYSIPEYYYAESERDPVKSFFELVTGTVRFVTGKIAKRNRTSFAIKTQTATIGVRGSSGQVTSCVDRSCRGRLDGTYLSTYEGILTLTSGDSTVEVKAGESAFCAADGSGCSKTDGDNGGPIDTAGPNLGPNYQQGEQVEHSHSHEEYSPPAAPVQTPHTPSSPRGGYNY